MEEKLSFVCDVLHGERGIGEIHHAKALKHQCTLYIAKRYQTISQLKLWTETFQEDPEIVSDVLNVLAEQGDN